MRLADELAQAKQVSNASLIVTFLLTLAAFFSLEVGCQPLLAADQLQDQTQSSAKPASAANAPRADLPGASKVQGTGEPQKTEELPQPIRMRAAIDEAGPLTLRGAVELARRNYPAIKAEMLKTEAAAAGITQAKTAYLPRADMLLDQTYGTANNVTGFLAPQNIVPNISGEVKDRNNFLGGFGFTSGALISWEPFDFGLRKAQVDFARASTAQARAQTALTLLEVQAKAADSFLSLLAARQVVRASQAKVERLQVFLNTVQILSQNELKAKTDQYLAEAELVRAKDELIAAEQNCKFAVAALIRWTGMAKESVEVSAGTLLKDAPKENFTFADPALHPQALLQQSSVDTIHARLHALERTYAPRFFLRIPIYARGSSFNPDLSLNFHRSYYPTTFNYAFSALMVFPALDFFQLKAERRAQYKNELAERSRYQEILLGLREQDARAKATIEAAIGIAENAPVKVKAAQEAANSARIRYRYQLASVNDVALDEQLLTQSEVEFSTAQLQVWRALLAAAVASGDLRPFLNRAAGAEGGP